MDAATVNTSVLRHRGQGMVSATSADGLYAGGAQYVFLTCTRAAWILGRRATKAAVVKVSHHPVARIPTSREPLGGLLRLAALVTWVVSNASTRFGPSAESLLSGCLP